jgi:hypothetical protein
MVLYFLISDIFRLENIWEYWDRFSDTSGSTNAYISRPERVRKLYTSRPGRVRKPVSVFPYIFHDIGYYMGSCLWALVEIYITRSNTLYWFPKTFYLWTRWYNFYIHNFNKNGKNVSISEPDSVIYIFCQTCENQPFWLIFYLERHFCNCKEHFSD